MGNGKSKEGKEGKGGLLAVSRNSIDEPPPTKSNTSIRTNQKVNIYVDESSNKNNNNNNSTNPPNNNTSLHQSQLSNDSSNNNNITTTSNTPQNNQTITATITSNTNTDSTTSSSPSAANTSVLNPSSSSNQNLQLGGVGGPSIVFGVDVSVAVQRSCKLILKMLLQKKQQESGNVAVLEEAPVQISEEKKNEYKHPLASDEEIQVIETTCAHLETLFIPEVTLQCLRFLNSYSSLLEQGVYRIPGDTQKMKEYKDAFDRGQSIDFLAENREIDRKRKEAQDNGITVDIVHHGIKHDAHDVAGLIKLFLRELPGDHHLFTPQTASEFAVSHLKNFATEEDKVQSVRTSLQRVPRANRDILKALCEHFKLIIKYEKSNKMTTDNLLKCICGTSPYVLAFYFMVQFFDIVFKEEKKEPTKQLTEEDMNSTKNIEWLLRAQNDNNNILSLGNLSALSGGNNNLSNEALAGKAMSARESRRKSYYQRQQRCESEDTPTTDQSDFNSPPTNDTSSENMDPITLALLKMKKDKDTIATNNVDSLEQDSSITVEM